MKGRIVALDHVGGRAAAALMVDGQLEDILFDLPDDRTGPGAIFRAKVGRPMKGQGGLMVSLPDGQSGFLKGTKGLSDGQTVLVQVSGVAEKGKALPVTNRLLFKGRYGIVTPGAPGLNIARSIRDEEQRGHLRILAEEAMEGADPSFGLILRTAASGATDDELLDELSELRALAEAVTADTTGAPELLIADPDAHALAWRDWATPAPDAVETHQGCFEDLGVLDALDQVVSGRWALPGGAWIEVEPTKALVAVDVNTGGDLSPAAAYKANLAAARLLPRALRLQGLGGQITLDPAPMPKNDRRRFEDALRAAFKADSAETALAGWTPLGHYELRRKRDRVPLAELYRP